MLLFQEINRSGKEKDDTSVVMTNEQNESTGATAKPAVSHFRDSLHTVDEKGRRRWIYPKRPGGKFYNLRSVVAISLLLFFFLAPFIKVKGEALFMLNLLQRKFVFFGQVFFPQDFFLVALMIIVFAVFIILFTVIYGRAFCGWACPQTVFMEFVFRQIEYLIEGDAPRQRKLAQKPWDLDKTFKKILKHTIFIATAVLIAATFVSYFTGAEFVLRLFGHGDPMRAVAYTPVIVFSAFFYFNYAFFREQACILLCPYGRLQGVLLDDKSIVVAYDPMRGEPRGKSGAAGESKTGDCIDCYNCVAVCPTGIDIRNGTQLECLHCTACIDACNKVMRRIKRPQGLIRYDSEAGIKFGKRSLLNARAIAYSAFLAILLIFTAFMLSSKGDVEFNVMRMPGTLYQKYGDDSWANIYSVKLINKSRKELDLELLTRFQGAKILYIGDSLTSAAEKKTEAVFMLVIPGNALKNSTTTIEFEIVSGEKTLATFETSFISP